MRAMGLSCFSGVLPALGACGWLAAIIEFCGREGDARILPEGRTEVLSGSTLGLEEGG
jgi:hypothetical protein